MARKARLTGLSPRENREVPPLRHDWVHRLKRDMPELTVILNGGVASAAEVSSHLEHVDGVMLGRAAYQNPWVLRQCERSLAGSCRTHERSDVVDAMTRYLRSEIGRGVPAKHISRHMLGLFQGVPGAKSWRRYLTEHAHAEPSDGNLLLRALSEMRKLRNLRSAAA